MSSVPDNGEPNLDWDSLIRDVLEKEKLEDAAARQIQQGARLEFAHALEASVQILTSPEELQNLRIYSGSLAHRHQQHFITPQFVSAVLVLSKNPGDQEADQQLEKIKIQANKSGFFIMNYTPDMMKERLQSPEYVIAESYGKHPDENHPYHSFQVPSADCQCWIPEAAPRPSKTIQLPESQDQIYDQALVDDCIARPWAYGEVKDISCIKEMNSLGLAGLARKRSFHEIENKVNAERGSFPIEYVAASIGQLKGIQDPSGKIIRLSELGKRPIKNERSVIIHTSGSYPASHAYTLIDRIEPVEINGETYGILVDWFMFFHHLKKRP